MATRVSRDNAAHSMDDRSRRAPDQGDTHGLAYYCVHHIASSRTGRSPQGRSVPLRHGSRGKWTTAPVIGSVCVVVTLRSVKLSPAVSRDVTVPETVGGSGLPLERGGMGIGTGALAG